jgi:hypothetical protein
MWPLWAVPAGLLGTVAELIAPRPEAALADYSYTVTAKDMADLSAGSYHVGMIAGYLAVACLLILAAQWRRHVESRFDWSSGAPVVSAGLIATAAGLAFAAGWMGALSRYLPGQPEETAYDAAGLFTYYILVDFGPYIAWLGALVSAGALGWMAWRERLVSRILGTGAALFTLGVIGATLVSGVPGLPGIAAPALAVAGIWLAVGRSAAIRAA